MFLPFLLIVFQWATSSEAFKSGDCGIIYDNFKKHVAYGTEAEHNEYPWHVAIYKMNSSIGYQYICGGTIIAFDVIVTAAHCVFNETARDIDYSSMMVIAGKVHSSWDRKDKNEQRYEVIKKNVLPAYIGQETRYQADIALLLLNDSIRYTDFVMPICIEWDSLHEPTDGELGRLPGWGYNENGTLSDKLQVSALKPMTLVDCRKIVQKGLTSFLTSDKFCANTSELSTLEEGDSGGGSVFPRNFGSEEKGENDRFYLYGVLSGRQAVGSYYLFTNISSHVNWIKSTLKQLSDESQARKICGLRTPINYTEPGGIIKSYTDYPWLATIYMKKNGKFFGIRCVATIIHQRAIITSHWCIYDPRSYYKDVDFKVLTGKHELYMNKKPKEDGHVVHNITKYYKHQNYVDWNSRAENDMVILFIEPKINFTKQVVPICMDWDRRYPIVNTLGMIASWDIDETHRQIVAQYRYLNISDCKQAFNDDKEYQTYVTSDKVCGRHENGTRFLYGSDIGAGYFFFKNGTTKHYLQGVVSRGRPDDQDFLIFTNVELYLRWINDIVLRIYNPGGTWY